MFFNNNIQIKHLPQSRDLTRQCNYSKFKMAASITDVEAETMGQKAIAAKDRAYCSLISTVETAPVQVLTAIQASTPSSASVHAS